jgi:hypothetical protein
MSDSETILPPSARLAASRRELQQLLSPDSEAAAINNPFPRSNTMRLLMAHKGKALVVAGAGGLLLMRSRLLRHALRAIPVGAVTRMFAVKMLNGKLFNRGN